MRYVIAFLLIVAGFSRAFGSEPSDPNPTPDDKPLRTASFPHLVAGDGWNTTYYITNLDPIKAADFQLRTFTPEGRELDVPWRLNFAIAGRGPSLSGVLRPGETAVIEISQPGDQPVIFGWAKLTSATECKGFSGFARYRRQVAGQAGQAYLVPMSSTSKRTWNLLMDNRDGHSTAVAIANDSPYSAADIAVRLVNLDGSRGPRLLLRVAPHGQIAFAIHDMFPQVKDCSAGIEFEAQDGHAGFSGFGLSVSPDGQLHYQPGFPND